MNIQLRYFASIREALGVGQEPWQTQAQTVAQLRREFAAAIRDYLRDCEEQGVKPEKPASGKLLLRVPPEVHSRAIVAAQAGGKSLNQWATEVLEHAAQPS